MLEGRHLLGTMLRTAPQTLGEPRGKTLDRRFAAELIVRHYQLCGIRLFRKPPRPVGRGTARFMSAETDRQVRAEAGDRPGRRTQSRGRLQ